MMQVLVIHVGIWSCDLHTKPSQPSAGRGERLSTRGLTSRLETLLRSAKVVGGKISLTGWNFHLVTPTCTQQCQHLEILFV